MKTSSTLLTEVLAELRILERQWKLLPLPLSNGDFFLLMEHQKTPEGIQTTAKPLLIKYLEDCRAARPTPSDEASGSLALRIEQAKNVHAIWCRTPEESDHLSTYLQQAYRGEVPFAQASRDSEIPHRVVYLDKQKRSTVGLCPPRGFPILNRLLG